MKKRIRKIAACLGAVTLTVSSLSGCSLNDMNPDKENVQDDADNELEELTKEAGSAEAIAGMEHSSTAGKTETVFVLRSGVLPQNIIVSDRLRNPSGAAVLKDKADLQNIEVITQVARY